MVSTSGHRTGLATLLHLSDLHFGAPEGKGHFWNSENPDLMLPLHEQRAMVDCLVEDLERQGISPDVVVVSGDLLDKGDESGVPLALDFLARLATALDLPKGRFVLVPGNHDVIRGSTGAEAYRHFDSLWKAFYEGERSPLDGKLAHEREQLFDYPELELQVVGFNSCEMLGAAHEEGCVSEAQRRRAEEATRGVKAARIRVAVMHHHLETPEGMRARDVSIILDPQGVKRWLAEHGFSLVLHGHQHLDWQREVRIGSEPDRESFRLAVVAAASLGVGTYGRKEWRLPLGYQVLCLDSVRSGLRIRREYSERDRRFGEAFRGVEGKELPVQHLQFGSPRVSSGPRRDMREFVPDFDALLEVTQEAHKPRILEHRAKAERNQLVDIVRLADDILDIVSSYFGEQRTRFATHAKHLITRLAVTVPVSPSGALAAELVDPRGRIAPAPVTTHLFVAILMAQGQGSKAVPLHYDPEAHFVRAKSEVTSDMLRCCATSGDAIEELERVLWTKLLDRRVDAYTPICKLVPEAPDGPPSSRRLTGPGDQELVTIGQCMDRRLLREEKGKCNQDCKRWQLYRGLVQLCRAKKRAFVVLKEEDADPWRTVAARVRDVSFVCFGEGDDSAKEIEEPVSLAIDQLYEELQGA